MDHLPERSVRCLRNNVYAKTNNVMLSVASC
jgi:hypothetical protein